MSKHRVRQRKLQHYRSSARSHENRLDKVQEALGPLPKKRSKPKTRCQLCDTGWTKPWLPLCYQCWEKNGKPDKEAAEALLKAKVADKKKDWYENYDGPRPW